MPPPACDEVLRSFGCIKRLPGLRNRPNPSIHAFYADGGPVRAIEMRVADRKKGLRLGGQTSLDGAMPKDIDQAPTDFQAINREISAIRVEFDLPL